MPDIHIMRVESGEVHTASISGGGAVSPTANVVKEGDAATITITDQYGTTTATVYDGQPGGKGDPGATPDISIGTVSTLDPGEDATVTISGTAEAPVLSFGIPQGAKGDDGRPVQCDWAQTDSSQPDFIKNKPVVEELTIPKDGTICTYINGKALKVLGSLVVITCKFGLTSGNAGWRTIATMPVGWRPAADVGFFAGRGGTPASVRDGFVHKNGTVEIYKESSDTYLYATITYATA